MVETLAIPVSARRALTVLVQERSPKNVEALGLVKDQSGAVRYFLTCASFTRASALYTLAKNLRRNGQAAAAAALDIARDPFTAPEGWDGSRPLA